MSVKIRLARIGKTNAPAYKVVVAPTRTKRTGRYLDIIGYFNPSESPDNYEIDKEKYNEWIKKGALPTKAVEELIEGTYEYKVYNPNQEESEEGAEKKEGTQESESEEGEGEENKS